MEIVTDQDYLHKPTALVTEGDDISSIVESLFTELKEHDGLGLSANQLGYSARICVMKYDPYPPLCLVNPKITKRKGTQEKDEGCFCLPWEVRVIIERPYEVVVKGYNQYFKRVRYRFKGLQARIACHEIDHLNGILITDRVEVKDASD